MSGKLRFWIALALYGFLALLVWTVIGYTPVRMGSRVIDFRLVPSVILGLFALRTVLFRRGELMRTQVKVEGSERE